MECPICNKEYNTYNTYNTFQSCSQCLQSLCTRCYQNILKSPCLHKSCPFCRKDYITEINLNNKHMDSFHTVIDGELGFSEVIRVSYLIGTALYFFHQVFSRTNQIRSRR